MGRDDRWNLPNLITVGRIALTVLLVPMILADSFVLRLLGFFVFLGAAVSDLWDGHVARSRGLVTDFGKLLDPIADKLLLASTMIPLYLLSQGWEPQSGYPWFGNTLPLWVLLVIFGRETLITVFRSYAERRGVVIPAGRAGKLKAVTQNVAAGAGILWYALQSGAREQGWRPGFWDGWQTFHRAFGIAWLGVALVLTVYSLGVYVWNYRGLANRGNPLGRSSGA